VIERKHLANFCTIVVFPAEVLKNEVMWDVTLCRWAGSSRLTDVSAAFIFRVKQAENKLLIVLHVAQKRTADWLGSC
jgi:hypothetical protein